MSPGRELVDRKKLQAADESKHEDRKPKNNRDRAPQLREWTYFIAMPARQIDQSPNAKRKNSEARTTEDEAYPTWFETKTMTSEAMPGQRNAYPTARTVVSSVASPPTNRAPT